MRPLTLTSSLLFAAFASAGCVADITEGLNTACTSTCDAAFDVGEEGCDAPGVEDRDQCLQDVDDAYQECLDGCETTF